MGRLRTGEDGCRAASGRASAEHRSLASDHCVSAMIAPETARIDAASMEVSLASGFDEPRVSARRLWRGGRSRGVPEPRAGQEDRSRSALLGKSEYRRGQFACARVLPVVGDHGGNDGEIQDGAGDAESESGADG